MRQTSYRLSLAEENLPQDRAAGNGGGEAARSVGDRNGPEPCAGRGRHGPRHGFRRRRGPFVEDDCAFISCGTWSVVGAIQQQPDTSAEAMAAGFINEFGLDSILFGKNIVGLYLFENLHRALNRKCSKGKLRRDGADRCDRKTLSILSGHQLAVAVRHRRCRGFDPAVFFAAPARSDGRHGPHHPHDSGGIGLELSYDHRTIGDPHRAEAAPDLPGRRWLAQPAALPDGRRRDGPGGDCRSGRGNGRGKSGQSGPGHQTAKNRHGDQGARARLLRVENIPSRATGLWDEHFHRYQEIAEKCMPRQADAANSQDKETASLLFH